MNRDRESLLGRIDELTRRLDDLARPGNDRGAEPGRRASAGDLRLALAEAEFRLAVLPGTEPAEAIERLRRALRHDPYAAKAQLHLGRLLHRGGRRWSALGAYREARRAAPRSRRAPLLMAGALLDLGRAERAVATGLLVGLARDDDAAVDEAVARFDELVERARAAGGGEPGTRGPKHRPARPPGSEVLAAARPPVWDALLAEQVARKPPAAAWVRDYLHAGVDPGTGAAAAAVLLACGADPAAVRDAPGAAASPEDPAGRVLAAALELAEAGSAAGFVALAARLVTARRLPAELACTLHFTRWAAGDEDVVEALALLGGYPPELRALDCFRELRLAILGTRAERAWAAERYDEAGVLWQAMTVLEPDDPDTAVNLAMLATRNRSSGYRPAWERVAELLYAAAARTGDLGHRAADRVALHRAHSWQSLRSAGDDQPDDDGLRRWIADGDAVGVWLREWDLYYLNARLGFRSPGHLLGIAARAGDEAAAAARDQLVRHLDAAVGGRGWSGAAAFERLARESIERAYAAREPDAHREAEQEAADDLLGEALRRALLLRRLADELAPVTATRPRELACAVLRHLFVLPVDALDRHCAERGLIASDERLIALLDNAAAEVAARWTGTTASGPGDFGRMLADVETAATAAPSSVGLAVPHARLLLWTGRAAEAYAKAAGALPRAGTDRMRDALAAVLDDAAGQRLEARTDGQDDRAELATARALMAEFPLSVTPRIAVARLLSRRGGQSVVEAARLLTDGARAAASPGQRADLYGWVRILPDAADAVLKPMLQEIWRRYRAGHDQRDLDHAYGIARARGYRQAAARLRAESEGRREPPHVHG